MPKIDLRIFVLIKCNKITSHETYEHVFCPNDRRGLKILADGKMMCRNVWFYWHSDQQVRHIKNDKIANQIQTNSNYWAYCHTQIFVLQRINIKHSQRIYSLSILSRLLFRYLFHLLHQICCQYKWRKMSRFDVDTFFFILCYVNWYTCQLHENSKWYHHVFHSVIFSCFSCVCESM